MLKQVLLGQARTRQEHKARVGDKSNLVAHPL